MEDVGTSIPANNWTLKKNTMKNLPTRSALRSLSSRVFRGKKKKKNKNLLPRHVVIYYLKTVLVIAARIRHPSQSLHLSHLVFLPLSFSFFLPPNTSISISLELLIGFKHRCMVVNYYVVLGLFYGKNYPIDGVDGKSPEALVSSNLLVWP